VGFAIDFAVHPWPSGGISYSLKRKVLDEKKHYKGSEELTKKRKQRKRPLNISGNY